MLACIKCTNVQPICFEPGKKKQEKSNHTFFSPLPQQSSNAKEQEYSVSSGNTEDKVAQLVGQKHPQSG